MASTTGLVRFYKIRALPRLPRRAGAGLLYNDARPMRLLLAFTLALASARAAAAPFADIRRAGTLRLATEGAFPPFNFYRGSELAGFDYDLGNLIAARMGLKPVWKSMPFDSLLIGLEPALNRYDLVIASHAITPERQKAVTFSFPYYCSGGVIAARPGGPRALKDLDGKVVAASVGTTYLAYLQKRPGGVQVRDVKTYPTDTDCLTNLMAGRVDAWVTDRFVALKGRMVRPDLQISGLLFQERVAMAMAKDDGGLKTAVDKALAKILKNGSYARLSRRYFAQDIRCEPGRE